MPELKKLNAKADEVKQSDQLLAVYDPTDVRSGKLVAQRVADTNTPDVVPVVVTEIVARGSENITMHTSFGKLILRRSAELLIGRMVPTDEDKLAEDVAYVNGQLDRFVTSMRELADTDVVAFLNDKLSGYRNDVASGLAWYAQETMKLSHSRRYAELFCRMLDHITELSLANDDEAETRGTVFVHWFESVREEVLSAARFGTHRSTSGASNMSDEAKLQAGAEIIDNRAGNYARFMYLRITEQRLPV